MDRVFKRFELGCLAGVSEARAQRESGCGILSPFPGRRILAEREGFELLSAFENTQVHNAQNAGYSTFAVFSHVIYTRESKVV